MSDQATTSGVRPNEILSPHHAVITEESGHWVIGGCDNEATELGLDRALDPEVLDPFGQPAQLFTVNRFATLHPCIRMDYAFQGVGYVGRIEPELTWSAHFRLSNSRYVRLVIFNRTRQIPHTATFEFGPEGVFNVHSTLNAEGLSVYQESLTNRWCRLGIGLVGGAEVGDLKNVFLYPTAPPGELQPETGSYIAGVKLERGLGMTRYQPPS